MAAASAITATLLSHRIAGPGRSRRRPRRRQGDLRRRRAPRRAGARRPGSRQAKLRDRAGHHVVKPNASRVAPRCPHFGVCGGCTLQHAHPSLQVAAKQRALEEALVRIGRVRAERMLPPIEGPAWGYRYRARLTVRHVVKKGVVLVGFHERKSSFVADMSECHVLPRKISELLPTLRTAGRLVDHPRPVAANRARRGRTREGDAVALDYVLVLRILAPLAPDDEQMLRNFADRHERRVLAADRRAGDGGRRFIRPASLALSAARIRRGNAVRANGFHAGQQRDQPRPGAARAGIARPAAGRAHRRFLLRAGQFHAADRPLRRERRRHRGQRVAGGARRRAMPRHNGLADRTRFVVANLFAATPESIAGLGPLDRS